MNADTRRGWRMEDRRWRILSRAGPRRPSAIFDSPSSIFSLPSSLMLAPTPMLPKAILFDMDGTLTEPYMDFDQMRRDMGIGPGPILETLAAMEPAQRRIAEAVLHRHEDEAATASTLNTGCEGLLTWL